MEIPYNILILPFLGGYIFVRHWNYTHIHTLRSEKDRNIIRASIAGLFSFLVAWLASLIGSYFFPCRENALCIPTIWRQIEPFKDSGLPIAAFIIASLGWIPLNLIFSREQQINRIIKDDADSLEMMLHRSRRESLAVSITTTNEKIYIGRITQPFNPATPTEHVGLIPLHSGYRDPLTKQMHLKINYAIAIEKMTEELDAVSKLIRELEERRAEHLQDLSKDSDSPFDERINQAQEEYERLKFWMNLFVVVIPANQIASASIFDSDVYTKYFLIAPET